jgi:hypothetical protein
MDIDLSRPVLSSVSNHPRWYGRHIYTLLCVGSIGILAVFTLLQPVYLLCFIPVIIIIALEIFCNLKIFYNGYEGITCNIKSKLLKIKLLFEKVKPHFSFIGSVNGFSYHFFAEKKMNQPSLLGPRKYDPHSFDDALVILNVPQNKAQDINEIDKCYEY